MSLDNWAERVLAAAAAAPDQASNIEAQLREISAKIDLIAHRQSLSEKAGEQFAGAVEEMGASYKRARESTGQVLSEAESRASSAVEEMTARGRELIDRASKSASEFFGTFISGAESESETTAEPKKVKPARTRSQSRANKATKSAGTTRRRSTPARKAKSEKSRGSQRRRSQPKSGT
jgi:hypothetical protein